MKAPSEEIYGKSTQGTQCWKVHLEGFNAVADNTGLFSFVCLKFREYVFYVFWKSKKRDFLRFFAVL